MDLWGKIVLTVDLAVLIYLMMSVFRLMKAMKMAGKRIVHVFPTPKMLIGTFVINIFGMIATTYSYIQSASAIYLMFLAVFLLNTFTMFSRIVGLHEEGVVIYGRLTTYDQMKKIIWGQEKKKFVELEIRLRAKDAVPLYINVPHNKKQEVVQFLNRRAKK
ncbi:hypothetical protein [Fusibacter sp. JL216-2]|uniref:hypothetical protein n=1 Tax=Fusibacter sp. JL216-2 TaxID=3071453 RepID=UPI003D32B307